MRGVLTFNMFCHVAVPMRRVWFRQRRNTMVQADTIAALFESIVSERLSRRQALQRAGALKRLAAGEPAVDDACQ